MATHLPELPPAEVNIRDYLDVLRRRKAVIVQTFVFVLAVGVMTTLLSRPVYEASAKLLVVAGAPQVSLVNSDNPLSAILSTGAPDSVATQVELMQSGPFLEKAQLPIKPPRNGDRGDQAIKIAAIEGTNVIRVTVQSHDPRFAANLANSIVQTHHREMGEAGSKTLKEALAFTTQQLQRVEKRRDQAERELLSFRRLYKTEELKREEEANKAKWLDLQQKLRQVETDLVLARSRVEQYREQLSGAPQTVVAKTQRPNPRYERLAARVVEAEERVDGLKEQFSDGSQVVLEAQAKLDDLREKLRAPGLKSFIEEEGTRSSPVYEALLHKVEQAENDVHSYEKQVANLQARLHEKAAEVNSPDAWEMQLAKLEREYADSEKLFVAESTRKRDLEIRDKALPARVREIELAGVPPVPVRPKKATNIILSVALALCLGLAMAFLHEYMDDRINSPEDADRAAHLPLLGHVPMIPDREPTVVTNLPARSHVAEAYRTLRSSIGFAAVDGALETLMVTSPSKGEGKTVTSLNLAIAMALDGKSVILVDADLRRPNIHKQLRIPQGPGLTDVLVGQKEPDQVLTETEVPGLRVMTSGPIPPNPAELLNSQPMDRIIESLREIADIVIFDSAPCIPVSDSIVLSSKVDGVVLVVHAGETKKAAVKHTREMLDRARARTIGLVFNKVPQRSGGYYHYYYYYYGGYHDEGPSENGRGRRKNRRRLPAPADPDRTAATARAVATHGQRAFHESEQEEA